VDGDESDEALMIAYRAGEARAFEKLLARHEKPVWNFLRRFSRDREAAEDLLQEVFLRVVKDAQDRGKESEGGWRGTAKFSTWLYTIARNLCIDRARRATHRQAASLDEAGPAGDEATATLHDRLASSDAPADVVVAERQAGRRIDRAIAELPDDQREVFLMREVMELPFAEIASVVGASEPTVKSRMRYALEKLRLALADLEAGATTGARESVGSG
jgi:RNA polymerase sigma-70 factor (ECF subfamily)